MQEVDPFLVFTDRLNQLGLCYMVTGSVAAVFYGEPRVTHDIDRSKIERWVHEFGLGPEWAKVQAGL